MFPEARLVDPESLAASGGLEASEPADAPAPPAASPETAGAAPEPSADGHLPPGASLEQRLAHYRETTIMRDLPGSEPGRCILRDR